MDFSPIMNFLNSFFSIFVNFFTWLATSITTIIWGALYIVVDGLLTVVVGIVGLIDVSTLITSLASNWGLLPGPIIWFINQSGLPQAMAIVGYAYLIRMTMNLIPATFTRI